jgi:serine/threonine protein kinase
MTKLAEERCSRCGGTLGAPSSGSITQWIAVCNCASRIAESDDLATAKTRMCGKCGKRIQEGRAGSLTQWVFRQDLCPCEVPEPIETNTAGFSSLPGVPAAGRAKMFMNAALASNIRDRSDETAIDVDPSKFPLDRFTPILEIGKGGSGTVYYCRDRVLDKIVAVKTLHALNAQQLLSFQNEARANSKLNHEAIIRVRDFGATESGVPYMSMDYVDGVSLLHLIEQGQMFSVDEVVELFYQVCKGLAHAHAAKILHRDIKSSNLLVFQNDNGRLSVCIIDFGVAVLNTSQLDQGLTLVGTPRYMPPDMARGEVYDERSEIYELGCTLFEALTGDTPFLAEAPIELVRQHAEEVPPRLEDRRIDVEFPEALEEILARCLEKEKANRFQSMDELAAALDELRPRGPQIDDDPPPGRFDAVAKTGGYVLITAVLVSGVVLALNLGLGIFKNSEKLTEEKALAVKDHDVFGDVMVDAASESLKPRFEEREKHGDKWTFSKGNVTNDSLVELARRKDIERLSLMGDRVDGRGLVFLLDLPLRSLDLDGTSMADTDMDVLCRFNTLEALRLSNTRVTGAGIARLKMLKNLESLGVGSSKVDDRYLQAVAGLTQLSDVYVRDSKSVTADGVASLAALPKLSSFTLKGMKIDSAMLGALKPMKRLSELSLTEARLDREILEPIKSLKLTRLRLHKDRISDDVLDFVGELKRLKFIDLTGSSGFSEAAAARLQKSLPKCRIEWM